MSTLYTCKLCGLPNLTSRRAHKLMNSATICPGDFAEQREHSCFTCCYQVSKACPDASVIRNAPWSGCGAWMPHHAAPECPTAPVGPVPSPGDVVLSPGDVPPGAVVPTPAIATVITSDQAALVDLVKRCDAGVRQSFEKQLEYAALAGSSLHKLKASCLHGEFEALVDGEAGLSKRSRCRYMEFFSLIKSKCATVALLENSTSEGFSEDAKKEALEAIYELADGKTWTAFYRDLKLIRDKKPKEYHPPVQMPEQITAARKENAEEVAKIWMGQTEMLMDLTSWSLLADDTKREIRDVSLKFGAWYKQNAPRKAKPTKLAQIARKNKLASRCKAAKADLANRPHATHLAHEAEEIPSRVPPWAKHTSRLHSPKPDSDAPRS